MAFAIHTLNNLMVPELCYTYSHSLYSNELEHSNFKLKLSTQENRNNSLCPREM